VNLKVLDGGKILHRAAHGVVIKGQGSLWYAGCCSL